MKFEEFVPAIYYFIMQYIIIIMQYIIIDTPLCSADTLTGCAQS